MNGVINILGTVATVVVFLPFLWLPGIKQLYRDRPARAYRRRELQTVCWIIASAFYIVSNGMQMFLHVGFGARLINFVFAVFFVWVLHMSISERREARQKRRECQVSLEKKAE